MTPFSKGEAFAQNPGAGAGALAVTGNAAAGADGASPGIARYATIRV